MEIIKYFLIANICLTISHLSYKIIAKNNIRFQHLRYFLIFSTGLSLLLPISNVEINFSQFFEKIIYKKSVKSQLEESNYRVATNFAINHSLPVEKESSKEKYVNWVLLLKLIYFPVTILLLVRIIMQIAQLIYRYHQSEKSKYLRYTILSNTYYKNSFSFFNWIFINKETLSKEDTDKIIAHEIIHASQYHSIDLILTEFLSALMWFNPIAWIMRKSMQLLHEYMADEGVLLAGIDKHSYQALLINQLTQEKLISITSNFNHSLIKKRIIMMTNNKHNQKPNMKILALFPLATMFLLLIACINGLFPTSIKASPKNTDSIQSNFVDKFQQTENLLVNDTTKNRKVKKSRKNKIPNEPKDTSLAVTSLQNSASNSTSIVDSQNNSLKNRNSDSIKPIALLFPNKTYFQNMLTFPDYKLKAPSINSSFGNTNNPLYIVDGVRTTINPISTLNAGNILSISVIRGGTFGFSTFKHDGTIIIISSKLAK